MFVAVDGGPPGRGDSPTQYPSVKGSHGRGVKDRVIVHAGTSFRSARHANNDTGALVILCFETLVCTHLRVRKALKSFLISAIA